MSSLSAPRAWHSLMPSGSGTPEIPQAIPSKAWDSVMPAPPRDRAPWHPQPPRQGWPGDPPHLQVLFQQRLPVSPISQAGWSPLGKPLVMYSSSGATGGKGAPHLRGHWKKVLRAIIPVLQLRGMIGSGLKRKTACRLPKLRTSQHWRSMAIRLCSQ